MSATDHTARWRQVQFSTSVGKPEQLPQGGIEVAFAGRSNAGKSSTLNTLCDQKGLARTSRTPGRTQLINLFTWSEDARLADLPGYGYAKAPEAVRKQWAGLVQRYFVEHTPLKGVVVIMDARRPLTPLDQQMVIWALAGHLPVLCLLNKADKLSRGAAAAQLQSARRTLATLDGEVQAELFSAATGLNLAPVRRHLESWLSPATA